jgi:hypothetical protein
MLAARVYPGILPIFEWGGTVIVAAGIIDVFFSERLLSLEIGEIIINISLFLQAFPFMRITDEVHSGGLDCRTEGAEGKGYIVCMIPDRTVTDTPVLRNRKPTGKGCIHRVSRSIFYEHGIAGKCIVERKEGWILFLCLSCGCPLHHPAVICMACPQGYAAPGSCASRGCRRQQAMMRVEDFLMDCDQQRVTVISRYVACFVLKICHHLAKAFLWIPPDMTCKKSEQYLFLPAFLCRFPECLYPCKAVLVCGKHISRG